LANRPRNFAAKIDASPAPAWNLPRIGALPFDWRINAVRLRYRLAPVRQPDHINYFFEGRSSERVRGEIAMTRSTEETRNRFDAMSVPGLSSRAQDAVNAALEAMSNWRSEAAESSEKNMKRVIGKMAAAAAELGWPEQIVDTARTQLQNLTEMQIKAMDQIVDAWEEQLKLPNASSTSSSAMLNKMKSPSGSPGAWPGGDAFQMGVTSPLQYWMTFAGQWQKAWTDMMTTWAKAGRFDQEGTRRH
jgi:hypothetical protein